MSLVNGGTYYGFTEDELNILRADEDYNDIVGYFTIPAKIDGTNYYFAPASDITNALDIMGRLEADELGVDLDFAVYNSAFGFKLIPQS